MHITYILLYIILLLYAQIITILLNFLSCVLNFYSKFVINIKLRNIHL